MTGIDDLLEVKNSNLFTTQKANNSQVFPQKEKYDLF